MRTRRITRIEDYKPLVGEIRIAEGHYNAYGQKLEITRDRLIFTRTPIDNPGQEQRAVRVYTTGSNSDNRRDEF